MRKVLETSILNVRGFTIFLILSSFLLVGCGADSLQPQRPVTEVEVNTVELQRNPPLILEPRELDFDPVNWIVLTPDNIDKQLSSLGSETPVLFAVTLEGYERLALNLSELRAYIQEQQVVIRAYEQSYE